MYHAKTIAKYLSIRIQLAYHSIYARMNNFKRFMQLDMLTDIV